MTAFAKDNVKQTSSKVYDALREKAPKSLAENAYASVYWSLLQDLIARLSGQNANWLANGEDAETVALPAVTCSQLLGVALEDDSLVLTNRIEFASLFNYLVCVIFLSDAQFMQAATQIVKDDKAGAELLAGVLTVAHTLLTRFTAVVPTGESLLEAVGEKLRHWLKKKKRPSPSRCLLVEFLQRLFDDKPFFVASLKDKTKVRIRKSIHSQTLTSLVEQTSGLLESCYADCSLDALEEAYEEKDDLENKGAEGAFLLCLGCVRSASEACAKATADTSLIATLQSFVPCKKSCLPSPQRVCFRCLRRTRRSWRPNAAKACSAAFFPHRRRCSRCSAR